MIYVSISHVIHVREAGKRTLTVSYTGPTPLSVDRPSFDLQRPHHCLLWILAPLSGQNCVVEFEGRIAPMRNHGSSGGNSTLQLLFLFPWDDSSLGHSRSVHA